jgi:hypothetical protein
MLFWSHKRVPNINWAITQKSHYLFILVNYACGRFLANYLAEYAFNHESHIFQRLKAALALIEFLS